MLHYSLATQPVDETQLREKREIRVMNAPVLELKCVITQLYAIYGFLSIDNRWIELARR